MANDTDLLDERAVSGRRYTGLGLGLSLVRHITELHGGTITASSDGKGTGATFILSLPLLGSPSAEACDAPDAVRYSAVPGGVHESGT